MANVSAELPVDWRAAAQLVQAGEYQQVADLLQTIQGSLQAENPLLALLAGSVQQICLACGQCRADRAWYEQASSATQSREEMLRSQAQSILAGISAQSGVITGGAETLPEPPPVAPAAIPPRPSRWSPVRGLLHQVKQLLGGEEESITPPLSTVEPPPADLALTVTEIVEPMLSAVSVTPTLPPAAAPSPEEQPELPLPSAEPPPADLALTVAEIVEPVLPVVPMESTLPPAPASVPEEQPESPLPSAELPPTEDAPVELAPSEPVPITPTPHDLVIYCLGPFRVYQQDRLIEGWNGMKGQMILKYLLAHRERPIAKEVLMDLFWPDASPEAARNNLNVAIYSLRRVLRQGHPEFSHILFQNDAYLLNPALRIWVDVEEFSQHFRAGHRLEEAKELEQAVREYRAAEALYQGEFLAEDRYEDWLLPRRQSLQDDYLTLLDRLSRYYLERADYDVCIVMGNKLLALDNCREDTHRRLMRCYSRQGYYHLALRQYHLCVEALQRELDVEPEAATQALYRQIRQRRAV